MPFAEDAMLMRKIRQIRHHHSDLALGRQIPASIGGYLAITWGGRAYRIASFCVDSDHRRDID